MAYFKCGSGKKSTIKIPFLRTTSKHKYEPSSRSNTVINVEDFSKLKLSGKKIGGGNASIKIYGFSSLEDIDSTSLIGSGYVITGGTSLNASASKTLSMSSAGFTDAEIYISAYNYINIFLEWSDIQYSESTYYQGAAEATNIEIS